jgi:hypothetical protein
MVKFLKQSLLILKVYYQFKENGKEFLEATKNFHWMGLNMNINLPLKTKDIVLLDFVMAINMKVNFRKRRMWYAFVVKEL